MSEFGELLSAMREGDVQARDALFQAAYRDLHRLAHHRLRDGGRNVLLDTTALVHESYLRLINGSQMRAEDRRAFFAYASRVMRSVIVDAVRERQAARRGGDAAQITLNTQVISDLPSGPDQILKVDEALVELAKAEPRLASIVEMRYFGGYNGSRDRRGTRSHHAHGHGATGASARMLLAVAPQDLSRRPPGGPDDEQPVRIPARIPSSRLQRGLWAAKQALGSP